MTNHDQYDEINLADIGSTFCTIAVTDRVMQQKHKLGGKTLVVQKVMEDDTDEDETYEEEPPAALKISGFKPSTHEDVLQMYFESKKKSGGGDIDQFEMSKAKDSVVITFKDPSGRLNLKVCVHKRV